MANQISTTPDAAVSITGLKKTYQSGTVALKGIDLEIKKGEFFALLGPNGAGKSTTIGVLCSLVNKSAGEVSIMGHCIDASPEAAKRALGVVPQEYNFSQFEKVLPIILNQAGFYGVPRSEALKRAEVILKQLELWDKRDQVSRSLSGGMKRRLMIARALIHKPAILILDEPTAGVDIEIRRSLWVFLKELSRAGTTIILTTHYLEEAEALCERVAIIDNGQLVSDSPIGELLATLQQETFVFDLAEPINELPENCPGEPMIREDGAVEIVVEKGTSLNTILAWFSEHELQVMSMRNKANRLEERFVKLVEEGRS